MRRFFALPCLVLPLLAVAQAPSGPVLERIASSQRIVLAHRESSVPFSYLDAQGKPVGYAMDLCLRLAEVVKRQLGLAKLEVAFLPVTPATRIDTIAQGRADLECGSTTNNAERRQKVAFTVPHYIAGARFLVRSGRKFDDLAAFGGHRLASTRGTTPLKALQAANEERLLRITVVEVADHAQGAQMVDQGEVDGFLMDDVLLYGLRAARPDPSRLEVVGKFLNIEPLAIMLSRDDPAFKRMVDTEMKRLIRSREAHALYDRWFLQPIPPRNTALALPMNHLLREFWKYPTDQVPF
jgi:ABC-type amino acid transport substrate-binding protein